MTFTEDEVRRAKARDLKIWVIGTNEEDFTSKRKSSGGCYSKYDIDISKYPDIYQKFITTKEYDEENINQYSKFFNEFVGMYYVWKNKKSKCVGFSHYRRIVPITLIDFEELDKNKIQFFSATYNNKQSTAPILKDILNHKYTYLYQVCCTNFANVPCIYEDLENYLDSQTFVKQKAFENFSSYHNSLRETMFIQRNIFVCKWEEFDKMMKFLSGYVGFLFKTHDIHSEEDFKNFYKSNIIDYYIKNWNIYVSKGYGYMTGGHTETEYMTLLSKTSGYELYPTVVYWRVFAYLIELLASIYIITSSKRTSPYLIECHNIDSNEYNLYLKIHKYLEKTNPDNGLIFSSDVKLAEMLQYHNLKFGDNNIKFVIPKYDISNWYSAEEKYLKGFIRTNGIFEKDVLQINDTDLIILDGLFGILNINLSEVFNNINSHNYDLLIFNCESINAYEDILKHLKLKYDISLESYNINCTNLFILHLNKKGED